MSKKTQITMFVILGLVLLILAIMFFGFMNLLKQKPANVKKIIDELETGRLKDHVTNCMIGVASEGLEKLGANGGVIYDFEGGTIPYANMALGRDYLEYNYSGNIFNVAYGLKKNTACSVIDYSISNYPYPGVSINNLDSTYFSNCLYDAPYDGFFGQNVMNKLCYLTGDPTKDASCESYANGRVIGLTIQKQLENYTSKKLPLCIDFDAFTQKIGANITVDLEPIVETNIHDSDILLTVKYPITISFENQEPITQILSYQATMNVRLARVYYFLHSILQPEEQLINFNAETEFITDDWRQGIELKRIRAPCLSCNPPSRYDDIIEVIDKESGLNGRPFIFRTAIENRRPVLDLISNQTIGSNDGFLEVPLNAKDPDDTTITFYFVSFGNGREDCSLGEADYGGPPNPLAAEMWCSKTPDLIRLDPTPTLHIPITGYDVGKHHVGILAVDETGLFDYQTFDITVDDTSFAAPASDVWLQRCDDFFRYSWIPDIASFPSPFNSFDNYDSALASYCELWRRVAANQCGAVCNLDPDAVDNYWGLFLDPCKSCITPIVYSEQINLMSGCGGYSDSGCVSKMPVCFWIQAPDLSYGGFYQQCYDAPILDTVIMPAFINTTLI